MIRKILIIILFFCFCLGGSFPALGKALTKGEALERISAVDFVKRKVGNLLSWTIGYDESKVSRASLVPVINYVKAQPIRVPPDGRTVLELTASVDDPAGLQNISGVRADLSNIGKLPNMMLVDNGLWGDKKAGDGVYTLQSNVSPRVVEGEKEIPVAVANQNGWLALSKTSVDIEKSPAILEAYSEPKKVPADGLTKFLLWVNIENPGGAEGIKAATADLSPVGLEKTNLMHSGDGFFVVEAVLPTGLRRGKYKIPIEVLNLMGGQAKTTLELEVR